MNRDHDQPPQRQILQTIGSQRQFGICHQVGSLIYVEADRRFAFSVASNAQSVTYASVLVVAIACHFQAMCRQECDGLVIQLPEHLLADEPAPAAKTERTADRSGDKPKEKLNESRSMGVAGKEEKVNDPWKDLEAQMNGMSITPPPAHKQADDDGMTSSFDDPAAPAASAKEEKIDMSDYSSMLGGINDNMTTNTAQYDPSWDLKMMEGLKDNDDDDDEMSSDNVGFFDL